MCTNIRFIYKIYVIFLLFNTNSILEKMSANIVEIQHGKINGATNSNIDGKPFYQFLGIPYAEPPIGNLRFKDPLPLEEGWSGIRETTTYGSACIQKTSTSIKTQSEDCLFLNVHTHNIQPNSPKKPVMVWIHGGDFTTGSSDDTLYAPSVLMSADIVFVSLNYRLGPLGFLQLPEPKLNVPGNAGLKDVVLALKWVQNNIAAFNGDADNVTLFGGGAGSAAVHYLLLAPLARGLFHRAILHSGSAVSPWARGENSAKKLSLRLGMYSDVPFRQLKYLQQVPVDDLVNFEDSFDAMTLRPFGPGVEYPHENALIDKDPEVLLSEGAQAKVPIIVGCATLEGAMVNTEYFPSKNFVPWNFNLDPTSETYNEVNDKIYKFYFGGSEHFNSNNSNAYNLTSDVMFANDAYRVALRQATKAPVYYYQLTLETGLNLRKAHEKTKGTNHGDDLGYLFNTFQTDMIKAGSLEDVARRRFVQLWSNFAKSGNPTEEKNDLVKIDWKAVEENTFNYLEFGKELVIKVDPNKERNKFWTELRASYIKN